MSQCPFVHGAARHKADGESANLHRWPRLPNLALLRPPAPPPFGERFNYAEEFSKLDYQALKDDLAALMTDSQPWWPADYGHYGPLFIRMAWHSAGTYRMLDGRGGASSGAQRLPPLDSWPDNANLDKARRLLWPIKKKYGRRISWADLMILAGNVALETMGFQPLGFAGGREDAFEAEDVDWGPEMEWLQGHRREPEGSLRDALAAVQMGLIYVNPEGPAGVPDPVASGREVRETFRRMGMNDEETVALVAGGHTFGKAHGAAPAAHLGPEPAAAPVEQLGLGWRNTFGTGHGPDTITSGIEGAWKPHPTRWDNGYFDVLFGYEWDKVKSPAGVWQWVARDVAEEHMVVDAHDPSRKHPPIMTTADLSLRFDPGYEPIARRFHRDPEAFARAFAHAWFKLTHRDMGPRTRYLGPEVPSEVFIWQDPVPDPEGVAVDERDVRTLKRMLLDAGLTVSELVFTAWSSASTFRGTDRRGGANGARIRLAPQRDWPVNRPEQLARVLNRLEAVRNAFQAERGDDVRVSLADLVVLAGTAAVEEAARRAGHPVDVGFSPGRTDASQEQTDIEAFAVLEPEADGFRNYPLTGHRLPPGDLLVERARLLTLTAPEMVVLLGGLRVLDTNADGSRHGVLTDRPGQLTPDFFIHLLDMDTTWSPHPDLPGIYEGRSRSDGSVRWTATELDLLIGADARLRAIAEVYASDDAAEQFVHDFARAWRKVMELDRFDLPGR